MFVNIDSSVITLYHFIDSGNYDALVDLIWKSVRQTDIKECFDAYRKILTVSKETDKAYESMLHTLNAALYFRRVTVPNILRAGDINSFYFKCKHNIEKYKHTWKNLVETHYKNSSNKKFILKHYEENPQNKTKKEFFNLYFKIIKDWASDESTLLSQFFYLDDLQANQKRVILENEPPFIFLDSLLHNPDSSYLQDVLLNVKRNDKIDDDSKIGGKVPNLVLADGVFRAEPYAFAPDKLNITEREDDFVTNFSSSLKIVTPKNYKKEEINSEFNYLKDVIPHGQYELATLAAIFQVGQDKLLQGNRISFTLDSICEKLGLEPTSWALNRISKAIFYLSINLFYVKLSDNIERYFHIISAIEKPVFNSKRQKEWTVEIDPVLRESVLNNLVTEIYADQITEFNYDLTALLFKIFILDAQQHTNFNEPREYTLSSLSQRAVLSGKPNQRKKKIINSLNELVSKQAVIEKYEVLDNGDRYLIYFSKTNRKMLTR